MNNLRPLLLSVSLLAIGVPAAAQEDQPSPAIASKIALRGEFNGIKVTEMRAKRVENILSIQVDLQNIRTANRTMFYRFRWIDNTGSVVGDGEVWKQLTVYGQQMQTIKGMAFHPAAVDFRLEMNVEP